MLLRFGFMFPSDKINGPAHFTILDKSVYVNCGSVNKYNKEWTTNETIVIGREGERKY